MFLKRANSEYRYEYDANGNIVREYVGDTLRYEYTYNPNTDALTSVSQGGSTVSYTYKGYYYDADPKLGFHKRVKLSASLTTKHKSAEEFPRRFCV